MVRFKFLTLLLGTVFVVGLVFGDIADGQRRSGGSRSSRPSSSRPSSSRPSSSRPSSSKPKYGSSGSSVKPSKPKYGSGSGSAKPGSTSGGKPKYGSSSGSSSGSSRPSTGSSRPSTGSSRPSTGSTSSKAQANKAAASKRTYESTKKATAPAKSSYTSSTGKSVSVRKDSAAVKTMRSRPSTDYTPAARTQRTTVHISNYGYSQPYSYYHNHSPYYMGGGYSSAYWWMMMEWDASRRARWLYNNQSNIESAAYKEGMQDAAVAAEVARLQAEGTADPNYIDPEFSDNPDLMYDQDYVEAAYNPTVVQGGSGTVLIWVLVIGLLFVGGYFVMTKMRFGR